MPLVNAILKSDCFPHVAGGLFWDGCALTHPPKQEKRCSCSAAESPWVRSETKFRQSETLRMCFRKHWKGHFPSKPWRHKFISRPKTPNCFPQTKTPKASTKMQNQSQQTRAWVATPDYKQEVSVLRLVLQMNGAPRPVEMIIEPRRFLPSANKSVARAAITLRYDSAKKNISQWRMRGIMNLSVVASLWVHYLRDNPSLVVGHMDLEMCH